jgi:NarL family two-component system response regulator YdfI
MADTAGFSTAARVLVVDDNDLLRVTVRVRAEADPRFSVVGEADNGQIAVELARTLHPDVIVLDHQMPVRTGIDALPDLRAAAPSAVIVMFSGDDDPDLRRAAMARGAQAFLIKGRDTLDDVLNLIIRLKGWLG